MILRKLLGITIATLALGCAPTVMPPGAAHAPPEEARAPSTLDGEVIGVDNRPAADQLQQNVRLRVQTETGVVSVLLAPEWVLDEKGLRFAPKERVRIKARKSGAAPDEFEAQAVKRGDDAEQQLRSESGEPLWVPRK